MSKTIDNADEEEGWHKTREAVLDRDDYECVFCGVGQEEHKSRYTNGLEAHHIVPRSEGGGDTLSNLVTVCKSCHGTLESIHAQKMAEFVASGDISREMEAVDRVWNVSHEMIDNYHDELIQFVEDHPTFAQEHEFCIEEGEVKSTPYWNVVIGNRDPDVGSEWEFMVAFGYVIAVENIMHWLDDHADFPFGVK